MYARPISGQPSELLYILIKKRNETGNVGPLYIDHACGIDSTNGSEKEKY